MRENFEIEQSATVCKKDQINRLTEAPHLRKQYIKQGYYDPDQTHFVSGNEGSASLSVFEPFFDQDHTAGYRLSWPYSNPSYITEWERFNNKSHFAAYSVDEGDTR